MAALAMDISGLFGCNPDYLGAVCPLLLLISWAPTRHEVQRGTLTFPRPTLWPLHAWKELWPKLVSSKRNTLEERRWWTACTSIFLHLDGQHLANNLIALFIAGFSVHQDLGIPGLYGVFLATGGIAGANFWAYDQEILAQLRRDGHQPRALIDKGWTWLRRAMASTVAPTISRHRETFGASGGISGLMGYGTSIAIELVGRRLGTTGGPRQPSQPELTGWRRWRRHTWDVLVSMGGIYLQAIFVWKDWQGFRGVEGVTGVAHSAHLTGFVAGAFAMPVCRLFEYAVSHN